jgi:hypothetical protein
MNDSTQINLSRLPDHLDAADRGASDLVTTMQSLAAELGIALAVLEAGVAERKFTEAYALRERARLRGEASGRVYSLRERATALAGVVAAVDEYLAPEAVLRRARFEPAADGEQRLLAESVNEAKRAAFREEVRAMTGAELEAEIRRAARDQNHAALAVLAAHIRREGGAHIADPSWSGAKVALQGALATVEAPDSAQLTTADKVRESLLDAGAWGEEIVTGRAPVRLQMQRAMRKAAERAAASGAE